MGRRQRRLIFQGFIALIGSLLFLAAEGVTLYTLIIDGDWHDVLQGGGAILVTGVSILVLTLTLFTIVWPIGYVNRARNERKMARLGNIVPATLEIDPALALRDGESVTVERTQTGRALAQSLAGLFIAYLFLCGWCVAAIFAILPSFGRSALNPFYSSLLDSRPPAAAPSLLDWLAGASPFILGGCFMVALGAGFIATRSQRLTADDRGLTWGRRFIAWSDIQHFVKTYARTMKLDGTYEVQGRERYLSFTLYPQHSPVVTSQDKTAPESNHFTGGYEAYERDARRILATIVTRGYQPLVMSQVGRRSIERMQRLFPEQAATTDQAEAAPLAAREWQPPTNPTITNFDVRLQPRIAFGRQILWTVVTTAILFGLFFLFVLFKPPAYTTGEGTGSVYFWGAIVGALIISVPIAAVLAFVFQRGRRPVIAADAKGVAKQTQSSGTTATIPWPEVRAWGVVPPRSGTDDAPRYFPL